MGTYLSGNAAALDTVSRKHRAPRADSLCGSRDLAKNRSLDGEHLALHGASKSLRTGETLMRKGEQADRGAARNVVGIARRDLQ